MKIEYSFKKHFDKNGFGLILIPSIYIGWENYSYEKVIQIDLSFLLWEFLFEIHII